LILTCSFFREREQEEKEQEEEKFRAEGVFIYVSI
jgi:hypothetical protein